MENKFNDFRKYILMLTIVVFELLLLQSISKCVGHYHTPNQILIHLKYQSLHQTVLSLIHHHSRDLGMVTIQDKQHISDISKSKSLVKVANGNIVKAPKPATVALCIVDVNIISTYDILLEDVQA